LSMIAICLTRELTTLFVILCAAQGLAVGPVMALPNYILSPDSRHFGIGIFYTLYYLGATTLPMLGGAILDVTAELASVIVFSSICLCLTPVFCSMSLHTLTRAKR
ncbi:hypothetical protein, partial [Calothrix rhizosoleniae]|uniref:hypothetical protein n=1 Tax=Calothrix rhizosoleniae TaxID=888997 RepID=UPI001F30DC10